MQDLNAGQSSTPKTLLKSVEEQMRALGIDLANSKKIAAAVASGALRNASPTDV
jgi:predicted amino acid dehydrogenase